MTVNKKATVLVVDDNPANLAVLFQSLRGANFKVLLAQDGRSGLSRIKRMRPDIVLLDVLMPDMDGFELCRRLSADADHEMTQIPIIFLSAMNDMAAKIKALNLSAVDYVTKPFQPEEVVARVERHLRLRNLQRSLAEKNADLQAEIAERKRVEAHLADVVGMLSTLESEALLPFIVERAESLVNANCSCILMPTSETGVREPTHFTVRQQESCPLHYELAVPLLVGQRRIGVLVAKRRRDFSDDEHKLLVTLATHAAMALENAHLYQKAQQEVFERRQAEKKLHEYAKQLQLLAQKVISVQEEERRRLSRELHDEAGQALTALELNLSLIHADLPIETLRQRLAEAIDLTNETHEQLRLMAHNLRPPELDTMPLGSTFAHFCRRFAARTGLSIDYLGCDGLPPLNHAIKICLYRFLQEALTNVAKHAHASQVYVTCRHDSHTVSLSVDDNGVGFDLSEGSTEQIGLGLVGMRERIESLAGELSINAVKGEGTLLVATLKIA